MSLKDVVNKNEHDEIMIEGLFFLISRLLISVIPYLVEVLI